MTIQIIIIITLPYLMPRFCGGQKVLLRSTKSRLFPRELKLIYWSYWFSSAKGNDRNLLGLNHCYKQKWEKYKRFEPNREEIRKTSNMPWKKSISVKSDVKTWIIGWGLIKIGTYFVHDKIFPRHTPVNLSYQLQLPPQKKKKKLTRKVIIGMNEKTIKWKKWLTLLSK